MTLEEALQAGVVKVTEKGEGAAVNELEVANAGDKPVYLQAGEAPRRKRTLMSWRSKPPGCAARRMPASARWRVS